MSRVALGLALLALTLAGGWAVAKAGRGPSDPGPIAVSGRHGGVHFRGQLDRGAVLEHGDGLVSMELVLSADPAEGDRPARIPTDLVVVLDRSGSMQGKPLQDAVASLHELIARLDAGDRFALVTYASDAQLTIPLEEANADNRSRWSRTADAVASGGGTNMAIGMDLAARTVTAERRPGRMPRVILLSDGHANEGDHSFAGLCGRARAAVTGEYVLSTVGVGQGFDESLMTALADAGTGNFYYVPDGSDLGDVFAGEFDAARETVASAVSVEIEPGPGVELVDAAGYPLERQGRLVRFRPGTLFAGQERRIWLSLRAPTDRPGDFALGDFRMTWREPGASVQGEPHVLRFDEPLRMVCVRDEARFAAALDADLVERGLVEEKLAALKQSVAAAVRVGHLDDARDQIRSYREKNRPVYEALGVAAETSASFQAAAKLEDAVGRAFTAPASPAARNALSKTLSAEGQDARRQGAKK